MKLIHKTLTIATANTAVQACEAAEAILGGVFRAKKTNAASVYIGTSTVTTSCGFELTPGDTIPANPALIQTGEQHGSLDLSTIYINGGTTCDKVDFWLLARSI